MPTPLERISELFADSVYISYKKQRYGLKTCKAKVDAEFAQDLRELYKRASEMNTCNLTFGGGCSKLSIEEKIKTL
jgi:hypothetical protein